MDYIDYVVGDMDYIDYVVDVCISKHFTFLANIFALLAVSSQRIL
jgi:hypothetical protein